MKVTMKSLFAVLLFTTGYEVSNAQSTSGQGVQEDQNLVIPDSYMQEQNQLSDAPGVASYNEESADAPVEETGSVSSSYGRYEATEEIRIYSGKQDGNNVVRTVQVKLPDGSPSSSFSYREYQPH